MSNTSPPKIVIICGGRHYENEPARRVRAFDAWIEDLLRRGQATGVREGGARGGDRIGRYVAQRMGLTVETMTPDWETHGKAAGVLRNQAMLDKEPRPVAVLALPGGRGTADMVSRAKRAGVRVLEYQG